MANVGGGYYVVILSKTLYCLHPVVLTGTGTLNAGGNPAMACYPNQGRVKMLLVDSCYRNRDKLRPDGPLGSHKYF